GGILTVGTPVNITANASSPAGTIAQVQFFENGVSIGTVTTSPYSISFTPVSTGLYTLTAVATDNSGLVTSSNSVVVEAAPSTGGVNTSIYFGEYVGLSTGDQGNFALVVADGVSGTFITLPYTGSSGISFLPDIKVTSAGSLSSSRITGTVSALGASGNLLPGNEYYIGSAPVAGSWGVASGYYLGSLVGQPNSNVAAIVGPDGQIMVYVVNGTYTD